MNGKAVPRGDQGSAFSDELPPLYPWERHSQHHCLPAAADLREAHFSIYRAMLLLQRDPKLVKLRQTPNEIQMIESTMHSRNLCTPVSQSRGKASNFGDRRAKS